MANILFISVNDINAAGIRCLSSYLTERGHNTSIIFLKLPGYPYSALISETADSKKYLREAKKIKSYDWVVVEKNGDHVRHVRGPKITSTEKEILISQIKEIGPDLIGFSVTAPLIRRISKISKYIKTKLSVPIIWGGAGATTDSDECADNCDFVCVGEGEKTLEEIAGKIDQNKPIHDVNNLCYKSNGRTIKNPLNPLIKDLDSLPFVDLNPKNKYLIEDDALVEEYAKFSYSGKYHMIGSRGCPYNCSYCTESYYKKLYAPERFIRRRSPQNIIDEIKEAQKIAEIHFVQFEDEIFSLDYEWLKEFSDLYKKEINLPFFSYIYPKGDLDKQISILKETGMEYTCLALQSGSEFINKDIFHRYFNRKHFLEMAHKLESWGVPYYTDVIVHNFFENEDDLKDTLDILLQINPFEIFMNKLYVLNNTILSRIVESGHKNRKMNQISKKINNYYITLFWFTLTNKQFVRFCQKVKIFKLFPSVLNSDFIMSKINYLLRFEPLTVNQLEKWKRILEDKKKWFNRRGIKYLLAITPNRHTCHPENILEKIHKLQRANRFDQLNEYLKSNSDLEFIDLRNQMKNNSEAKCSSTDIIDSKVFDRYKKLFDILLDWFPEEKLAKKDQDETDISSKTRLSAILLRDSLCGHPKSSFFEKYLDVTIKFEKKSYDLLSMKEIIDQKKPDIVIDERPERAFDLVPTGFGEKLAEDFFNDSSDSLLLIDQNNVNDYIKEVNQLSVSTDPSGIYLKSSGNDPNILFMSPGRNLNGPILIKIIITSPSDTDIQIYYQTKRKPFFAEEQSELMPLKKDHNTCYFQLLSKDIIAPLRFDPGKTSGEFVLHSFEIRA